MGAIEVVAKCECVRLGGVSAEALHAYPFVPLRVPVANLVDPAARFRTENAYDVTQPFFPTRPVGILIS